MDFGSYPPEVNSARMFAGAGSGPMLAAAEAWAALAAGLNSAANSCQAVVSALTAGPWLGPSSESMSAAARVVCGVVASHRRPGRRNLRSGQGRGRCLPNRVFGDRPPPMVAANRSQLMTPGHVQCVRHKHSGDRGTEAQYGQMWAQDVAAMYGYAASSASATALTPFNSPPQTTNPGGLADQAAAAQATGIVQSTVQQAFSAVPSALQSAAAATPAAAVEDELVLLSLLADLSTLFFGVSAGIATLVSACLPMWSA